MGRYSYSGRGTVEAAKRIELPWLRKQGYFPKGGGEVSGSIRWSWNGEPSGDITVRVNTESTPPYLQMVYRVKDNRTSDDEWQSRDYKFNLEKTPCRFGGHKWFVRCQLSKNSVYCGRRARVLYLVNGYFGCRHCADLTYQSCRDNGFVSIPDVDEVEAKVKRMYYAGKPTKQYKRFLRISERFENSFIAMASRLRLGESRKK